MTNNFVSRTMVLKRFAFEGGAFRFSFTIDELMTSPKHFMYWICRIFGTHTHVMAGSFGARTGIRSPCSNGNRKTYYSFHGTDSGFACRTIRTTVFFVICTTSYVPVRYCTAKICNGNVMCIPSTQQHICNLPRWRVADSPQCQIAFLDDWRHAQSGGLLLSCRVPWQGLSPRSRNGMSSPMAPFVSRKSGGARLQRLRRTEVRSSNRKVSFRHYKVESTIFCNADRR